VHELASGLVNTEACQQALTPQIRSYVFNWRKRERGEEIGVRELRRQHTIAGDAC